MTEPYQRPDPDALLRAMREEGPTPERTGGYLKIFLGYIAGVGKTFRMLNEAHMLQDKGHQVLAGVVETHGREDTSQLLEGLDVLPPRIIDYRGLQLPELDLETILARRPEYVLVDELAHTNVPGARHTKRYQDVAEILEAGINVYTTLNVQHIESLHDVARQITGVEVKESVPDSILKLADKVELVDLPTEELLQRLEEGKVYIPDKAKQAGLNFFKPGNLLALRELALRYAATRAGVEMHEYLEKHGILGPWDASSRLMVCISASPSSEQLIRITHRFAESLNAEWYAVYVEPLQQLRSQPRFQAQLDKHIRLAEELGGKVARLTGPKVADEIVTFAKARNITLIIIGFSRRSKFEEFRKGSVINELLHKSSPIQVLVIEGARPGPGTAPSPAAPPTPPVPATARRTSHLAAFLTSLVSVSLTTLVCHFLHSVLSTANASLVFLIPVVLSGVRQGIRGGLWASILSVAAVDFFFVPPYFTFNVADWSSAVTFLVLFFVGLVVSMLTETVKRQAENAREREQFIASLYDFSKDLLSAHDLADLIHRSTQYLADLFHGEVMILLPDAHGSLEVGGRVGTEALFDDNERGVANWAFTKGHPAGYGTQTLSSAKWYYLPLKVRQGIVGILAVAPHHGGSIKAEQQKLLESFGSVVSLALANLLE